VEPCRRPDPLETERESKRSKATGIRIATLAAPNLRRAERVVELEERVEHFRRLDHVSFPLLSLFLLFVLCAPAAHRESAGKTG